MSSYLASARDFVYRRRKPFIIVGGVVGGAYMLASYAISKIGEVQTRLVEDRRDKENLRKRFAQNQEDCNFTVLALLPTLGDQIFPSMDVESLTAKLQKGRGSPNGTSTPAPIAPASAAPDAPEIVVNGGPVVNGYEVGKQEGTEKVDPSAGLGQSAGNADEKGAGEEASKQAMEEIWNKLSHDKENENQNIQAVEEQDAAKAVNGVNGTHSAAEVAGDAKGEGVNGSQEVKSKASAQGLDAVSEPAPAPIRSDARLTPSPQAATPTVASPSHDGAKEEEHSIIEAANHHDSTLQSKTIASNGISVEQEPERSVSEAPKAATELLPSTDVKEAGQAVDSAAVGTEADKPRSPTQTPAPEAPAKEPSPEEILAEKQAKLALWNELKLTTFSRTLTTLYALVLLSLQTHIQLNLIGRFAYLTSVQSMTGPAPSDHRIRLERHDGLFDDGDEQDEHDEYGRYDDAEGSSTRAGLSKETERLYLTFSWYFLHRGWQSIATLVKDAVEDVFGSVPLKAQLTHNDFVALLNKVRRRVEYEARQSGTRSGVDDDGTSTLAASMTSFDGRSETSEARFSRRGRRRNFLSSLFPSGAEEEIAVLEAAGALSGHDSGRQRQGASRGAADAKEKGSLPSTLEEVDPTLCALIDETKDVIESSDFSRLLKLSLDTVFAVFEGTLRPTFGVEPRAIASDTTSPVELIKIQEIKDDDEEAEKGRRIRLATLFPAVARQSQLAIHGVPNEYVDALSDIKELRAFSAVLYSSWD